MKVVIAGGVLGGVNNLSDVFRAREAGNVNVLGVFDLARNSFMVDVPTLAEQGFDIDNASVNFRGVKVQKMHISANHRQAGRDSTGNIQEQSRGSQDESRRFAYADHDPRRGFSHVGSTRRNA